MPKQGELLRHPESEPEPQPELARKPAPNPNRRDPTRAMLEALRRTARSDAERQTLSVIAAELSTIERREREGERKRRADVETALGQRVGPDKVARAADSLFGAIGDDRLVSGEADDRLGAENRGSGTEIDATLQWQPEKTLFDGTYKFKVNGPVRVELNNPTMGLDGLEYHVDWHPLDEEGNVVAEFRKPDHMPMVGGGHALPSVPKSTTFEPPYDNPSGFEVRVSIPPQGVYNANSARPYLNVYTLETGRAKPRKNR